MPIPAFTPVLRPPLVSEDGVEEPDTVADPAVEAIVFVLCPVLTVEAIVFVLGPVLAVDDIVFVLGPALTVDSVELVELDELVVLALDEMLNHPETATGLVCPS
jgi:hypothetical protein